MSAPTDDNAWKRLIRKMFPHFFEMFTPWLSQMLLKPLDFVFLDKELEELKADSEGHDRISDLLVKVKLLNGKDCWLLIHIEVQGYNDDTFPDRMFQMFYRIRDRYNIDVYSTVIFTADIPNEQKSYKYNCCDLEVIYNYPYIEILKQNEFDLLKSENPFAYAVVAAKKAVLNNTNDNKKELFLFELVNLLMDKNWSNEDIFHIVEFIEVVLRPKDRREYRRIHDRVLDIFYEGGKTMIAKELTSLEQMFYDEGIDKGIDNSTLALSLLKAGVSIDEIIKKTKISKERLIEFKKILSY